MLIAFQLTLLTVSDDISQPGTFQHIFLFWLTFFTKAVIHLPLFFAQLTLILSFQLPIASCCDLVHYGSWTGCIWWKGRLLSQPLAWIGILISIHYYQRISTPSSRGILLGRWKMHIAHVHWCVSACMWLITLPLEQAMPDRQSNLHIHLPDVNIGNADTSLWICESYIKDKDCSDWHYSIPLLTSSLASVVPVLVIIHTFLHSHWLFRCCSIAISTMN